MCAVRNDRYPHVFSPLKIRGVTLKNRLEYSPTVVLKCTPEGDVTEEMLTYLLPLIQGELPCTYKNGVPVHLHLY